MVATLEGHSNPNARLSFTSNVSTSFSRSPTTKTFLARVRRLGWGWQVVASESAARLYRAFYPMKRTFTPFVLQFECKGYSEYRALMTFLRQSTVAALGHTQDTAAFSFMSVVVEQQPGMDHFFRLGIPVEGMDDGDHVGSMVFSPVITFMPFLDPTDKSLFYSQNTGRRGISWEDLTNTNKGDASKFYYPRSAGSLDPNLKGQSLYDVPPVTPTPQPQPSGNTGGQSGGGRPVVSTPPPEDDSDFLKDPGGVGDFLKWLFSDW